MLSEARGLDDLQLAAVADLERRVVTHDGGRLKLEWGVLRRRSPDEVNDVLFWEQGTLVGFAGLYQFGLPAEVAGMVDPTVRRRGIGSALLRRLAAEAAGRGLDRALVVVPRSTGAGAAFARSCGGTLGHSEHFLVLGALASAERPQADVVVRPATSEDVGEMRRILAEAFGTPSEDHPTDPDDRTQQQLVIEQSEAVVGALRLNHDGGTTGIYGFAVDPARQGRGIGRDVLGRVCAELRRDPERRVTLEVAVHNDRALRLYTSVGFEPTATEDYYLVPAPLQRSPR